MYKARVVSLLVVIAAASLFVGVVSAEGPDSGDSEDEASRVFTHPADGIDSKDMGSVAAKNVSVDVWTCYIDLDYPHYSHHAEGHKVNVSGEVNCDQIMEVLSVRMTLWKWNCIWFICAWDMIGDSGWDVYPATNYAETNAAGPCVHNTTSKYYGKLNAEMTWPNGDVTYGYNVSPIREVLCARR